MSEMTGDLSYDVLVCGAGRSEVGDFSYDPLDRMPSAAQEL